MEPGAGQPGRGIARAGSGSGEKASGVTATRMGNGGRPPRREQTGGFAENRRLCQREFCKHDTAVGGLQIFGTAVVAIVSVASKSPDFCKFGIAVG